MMPRNTLWVWLLGAVVATAVTPACADELEILSLSPVGSQSCIAAPIALAEGQVLTGISWLNNDSSQPFPRLLLMEGLPGVPPDVSQTGMVLQEVTGEALAWGDVSLEIPVTSSTGFAYAVWVFPAEAVTTGQGMGQGPGIGIRKEASTHPFYLSGDGVQWMEYSTDYRLCVQPIVQMGAARSLGVPRTLGSLASELEYGPASSSAAPAPVLPSRTALRPGRPNPFNPRTVISYDLASGSRVSLDVYDTRGRHVVTLVSGSQPAGVYEVTWMGTDARGAAVSSGVYFVRLKAGDHVSSDRVTLVR